MDRIDYIVENKRTGGCVSVPWNTFLPIGTWKLCQCSGQCCRCVYVDSKKSAEFGCRGNRH
jgi:hypothetical protein